MFAFTAFTAHAAEANANATAGFQQESQATARDRDVGLPSVSGDQQRPGRCAVDGSLPSLRQ